MFFQCFVAPEGRQVGSLKRQARSQLDRWEMKNCTPLWREAHFEVKMYKTHQVRTTFGSCDVEKVHAAVVRSTFGRHHARTTFGSWDVEKVHALVARSTFPNQILKTPHVRTTFGRRKGLCMIVHCEGFCSMSKNDGRRGTFEEDLQRCIFRGRRSTRDMFIRDVTRSGRWFPERGCILEHQLFSFGKIFLRVVWPGITFSWQAQCFGRVEWKNLFEGRLAELLRFWCCQLRKLRKSRRIAVFLTLSSSIVEEVSQNCFVYDVVKFKSWGSLSE